MEQTPTFMERLRAPVVRLGQAIWQERVALLAGLLGALLAALVMVLLRFAVGAPTLPELVGERLLPLLPVNTFIQLLNTFQPNPKTGPLFMALLGMLVLGIVLGPLLRRLAGLAAIHAGRGGWWSAVLALPRRAWLAAGGLAAALELVTLALFWPVMGQSLLGFPPGWARLIAGLATFVVFLVFAVGTLVADQSLRAFASAGTPPTLAEWQPGSARTGALSRRRLFGAALAIALVEIAGLGAALQSYLERSNLAYEGSATPPLPRTAVTPAEDFYVVSKNVLDPVVDTNVWRLEVGGLVHHPRSWTFEQVRQLPAETRAITLECISNGVGARLMSTAIWQGVPLVAVLEAAGGVQTAGKYVIFTSVDGFTTSLPLADLVAAKTLLAWEMNGQLLPAQHGAPLRVVVPGRYGEQSAKWLTRVAISDQSYKGFYQSQGWGANQIQTTSRIDLPGGTISRQATMVQGIAFAGIRGIRRVEVSADHGKTWNDATLTPPLSDQTWVFWSWVWTPPAAGRYTLAVRATDGTGTIQTATPQSIVPDGATGIHQVAVVVR